LVDQTKATEDTADGGAPALRPRSPLRLRSDLTEGSIPRVILRIALPTWAAFLTHDLMGIVDMFFVGKLGPAAVASVAMSGVMFGIIIMVSQGISAGTMALVANAIGTGDRGRAGDIVGQSLAVSAILAAFVAVVGILLAGGLMRVLGAADDVAAMGAAYLRIVAGGSIAMMLMMIFGAALRAAGDARTPLMAMVLGNVVNAVLDPIFIFGLAGMPALGVAGSAWATVLGRTAALAVMVRVFFGGRHEHFHLHLRDLRPRAADVRQIVGIGVFASGRMLLRNVGGLLLMRLVAVFGTVAVAAFGISMRLQMFVFGPSMGFGTAAAALVGQNVGAGKPERAEKSAWLAAGMVGGIVACVGAIFWFAGGPLVAVFNDDPEVVAVGANLLRWISVSFVFLAASFVFSQAMTGGGDTLFPMLVVGVSLILVGLPLAYALADLWGNVQGVWAAISCSNVMAGLFAAWAFRHGRWRVIGARIRQAGSTRLDQLSSRGK
jgi:putative MATE family efflux protein